MMALCPRSASIAILCSTALVAVVFCAYNSNESLLNDPSNRLINVDINTNVLDIAPSLRKLAAVADIADPRTVEAREVTVIDDPDIVPVGDYEFPSSGSQPSDPVPNDIGRVLLYVTSHFSSQHEMYLRYCWKNLLARSPLLQGADVAVYLNPNDAKKRKPALDVLKNAFADNNLMVYLRDISGLKGAPQNFRNGLIAKRSGAIMAVQEAVESDHFEGYDWIIRVNPDVLIRDDSFFRENMANPDLSALLINCARAHRSKYVHSDFFVVRPQVFNMDEMPKEILEGGAEAAITAWVTNTVLNKRPINYKWIPGADPASKHTCRAGEGREYFDSPVVHEHTLHPDICTIPEADQPVVNAVMSKSWPKNWKPV